MNKNKLLQLRALASQEYSVEQIADKLSVSREEVEYIMLERGYRRRYDEPRSPEFPRYQKEIISPKARFSIDNEPVAKSHYCKSGRLAASEHNAIIEYWKKGDCATVIARKIGRHPDTVHRVLRKFGYE